MKTLKKTLCLVLAVVMAVGVLVLPANAETDTYNGFDDIDKIDDNYAEAVATLTGMGIIKGTGTGFSPKVGLNRQDAAQLIVNVMLTEAKQTAALKGYTSKFVDIDSSFAKDAIAYLAAKGIVTGKDDTHFYPLASLTGNELLTLLRRVAEEMNGYKSGNEEWTAEAMKFATEYGVFAEIDDGVLASVFSDPDKALTREEAAQIIFSVITHNANTNATGTYTVTVDKGEAGTEKFPGVTLEQAMMLQLTYQGYDVSVKADGVGGSSIGKSVYGLTFELLRDPYGRPFWAWTNGLGLNKNTVVYSDFDIAGVDYTDKVVTYDKIFNDDLKVKYPTSGNLNICVYVDGVAKDAGLGNPDDGSQSFTLDKAGIKASTTQLGGRGVDLKVYKTGDYSYTIVLKPTYVAKLGSPASDGKIYIAGKATTTDAKDDITVSSGEYSKNDIVLYTKGVHKYGSKIGYLASEVRPATPVEGNVSNKSNSSSDVYFRLNGESTKYYVAKNAESVTFAGLTISSSDIKHFWVDERNNVYHNYPDSATVDVAPDYIYVIEYDQFVNSASSGLYENSNVSASAGARIKYLDFATGNIETADLAVVHGTDTSTKNNWYLVNPNTGMADTNKQVKADAAGSTTYKDEMKTQLEGKIFAVSKNSKGQLMLGNVSTNDKENKVELYKDSALVKIGESDPYTTVYANGNTNLVMIFKSTTGTTTTYSTTTYHGYRNFVNVNHVVANTATYTSTQALIVMSRADGEEELATNIYVIYDAAPTGTPSNEVNGLYLGTGEQTIDGYTYNFLVDGETVAYTSLTPITDLQNAGAVNDVYTLTCDTVTGALVGVESKDGVSIDEEDVLIDETTIVIGNVQYTLTADTIIFDATGETPVYDTELADVLEALAEDDSEITATAYCLSNAVGAEKVITLIVVKPVA